MAAGAVPGFAASFVSRQFYHQPRLRYQPRSRNNRVSVSNRVLLFRPYPGCFDDRPPFFDLSFLLRCEPLRRLFVTGPRLLPELDTPLLDGWISQAFDYGIIEFGDD